MSLNKLRQKKSIFLGNLNLPQEKLRIAQENVKLRDPQVVQDGLRRVRVIVEREQEIQTSNGEVDRLSIAHKDQLSNLIPRSAGFRSQPNIGVLEADMRHGKMTRDELLFRATDDDAVTKHLQTVVHKQDLELFEKANSLEIQNIIVTGHETANHPHKNPYLTKESKGTTLYNKERRKALKVSYTAL